MTNFKLALEATTDRFRSVLPEYGFGAEPRRETDGAYRRIWTRCAKWKKDEIEIVYRRGGESRIIVNFGVLLPIGDNNEMEVFDGGGWLTPYIPTLKWKWVMQRYAGKVMKIVESNLKWFDSFETPNSCLASINNPERNGPHSGKLFDAMCEYLKSLDSEG